MIIKNNYGIIVNKANQGNQTESQKKIIGNSSSFEDVLNQKINSQTEIKFSKHAEQRLKSRNINLTNEQKEKLNEAVKKAEQKAVKDSLILLDNIAFVVSVKNKTVVTVLNGKELNDNVFTNIDGAVVV